MTNYRRKGSENDQGRIQGRWGLLPLERKKSKPPLDKLQNTPLKTIINLMRGHAQIAKLVLMIRDNNYLLRFVKHYICY